MNYDNCHLCPRSCGVNRTAGETGFCKAPATALVAKSMLHHWEEPALAGKNGSGAIFFGGCSLGCRYCQNIAISAHPVGEPMDSAQLRSLMESLIAQGADNIDLVTPTQYLPTILPALEPKLPVPVIYNCGGYESLEALRQLEGKVDIYLPDLKYVEPGLALRMSIAPDYFETATAAIREMVRQTGAPVFDGNRLIRGTVVRHLILPGHIENTLKILDWLGYAFRPGEVLVSLMRQYTPMPGLEAPFNRPISDTEYDAALAWMFLNNLDGFTQEQDAASNAYIPDF